MQLLQATINHISLGTNEEAIEILIAQLFDFLQDGSWESEAGLVFTIEEDNVSALLERLQLMGNYSLHLKPVENINWNAKWEANYDPIDIGNYVHIRADFHPSGNENFTHEIVINPNMAFGTGHHETTKLMIMAMQGLDLRRKQIIDVGSGTGVLAIVAAKENAIVRAVEKHDIAYENMVSNVQRNNVQVECFLSGFEDVPSRQYDIILANITREVHLKYAALYRESLKENGMLWLSGFYLKDSDPLIKIFSKKHLKLIQSLHIADWCCLGFIKV